MCDGALSINLAKQIDDKYGVDVFYFSKDTLQGLIADCNQLMAMMDAEKLDVMPGNPDYDGDEDYDDEFNELDDESWEDDWCDDEEDEDYSDDNWLDDELEDSHLESPNT